MEKFKDIVNEMSYMGRIVNWSDVKLNDYVLTGAQMSMENIDNRLGRVVQIRLDCGCYGSDSVLIRHINGSLTLHENQSFYPLDAKYINFVETAFNEADIYLDNPIDDVYSIDKSCYLKGFILTKEEVDNQRDLELRESKIDSIVN